MNQINRMFNDAPEDSDKRVILERHRQEVMHEMETLESQVAMVAQSRIALGEMNNSTEVIHRQGDWRLMTASLVDTDIPFTVRRSIEAESLMTFRLEPSKTLFVPSSTRVTTLPPMFAPDFTTFTFHNPDGNVQLVAEHSDGGYAPTTKTVWTANAQPVATSQPVMVSQPAATSQPVVVSQPVVKTEPVVKARTVAKSQPAAAKHYIGCQECHDANCDNCPYNGPVSAWNRFWHGFCTKCPHNRLFKTTKRNTTRKTVVRPVSNDMSGTHNSGTMTKSANTNTSKTASRGNQNGNGKPKCNIPFPIKLLVPPCWFENSN